MAAKTTDKETKTPDKPLTLQQKFVKLREAVPEITQKKHSDGVKYKFAKIFDVYELLTPAMNEHGVNFDIVAEKATRHTERGDAVYYTNYTQNTKNGARTVWVYEADLTIRWTNADDPEDILEVTLHALGTNDSGPDKAKGSAWTYCLKYYLFEKFGIDQGDDDPDMKDLSDGTVEQKKQGTGQKSNASDKGTPQGTQNGQNGQKNANKELTDLQLSRMYKKGTAAGLTQEEIDETIFKKYGHKDPHKMTREQYDESCAALDKLAASQTEGGQENA